MHIRRMKTLSTSAGGGKPYDWDTENLYKIEIFKTVKTMLVTDVGDEMCLGPILRC